MIIGKKYVVFLHKIIYFLHRNFQNGNSRSGVIAWAHRGERIRRHDAISSGRIAANKFASMIGPYGMIRPYDMGGRASLHGRIGANKFAGMIRLYGIWGVRHCMGE